MKRYLVLLCPIFLAGHPNDEISFFSSHLKQLERLPITYSQTTSHCISSIADEKKHIQLNDGSQWEISLFDRYKLDQWTKNQPVLITQNPSWVTGYKFRIINSEAGNCVEAGLSPGSWIDEICGNKIKAIHAAEKIIELHDGTCWELSRSDASLLEKWKVEDLLIGGFNSGQDHQSYANLIVHVRSNTCAQARQVFSENP